jgi:predicted nucleotidyltransferase
MSIISLIESNHSLILNIAIANGVKKISLFGSAARDEDHAASDIDFLVEFEDNRSLFDLIRLKNYSATRCQDSFFDIVKV